jgi:hypothetical protein
MLFCIDVKNLSLALTGKNVLRCFEKRVLWTIFECWMEEGGGRWRGLPGEGLLKLYGSPCVARMGWAVMLARTEENSLGYAMETCLNETKWKTYA